MCAECANPVTRSVESIPSRKWILNVFSVRQRFQVQISQNSVSCRIHGPLIAAIHYLHSDLKHFVLIINDRVTSLQKSWFLWCMPLCESAATLTHTKLISNVLALVHGTENDSRLPQLWLLLRDTWYEIIIYSPQSPAPRSAPLRASNNIVYYTHFRFHSKFYEPQKVGICLSEGFYLIAFCRM